MDMAVQEMTAHDERIARLARVLNHCLRQNHRGKHRPVTGGRLADWFGFKSDVEVREVVHLLRTQGVPVGSCSKGYFLAVSKDEVQEVLDTLWGRINAMVAVVDALQPFADGRRGL